MEANSNDANATTCIPMLEKLFITTPDVTREGDDNTSHNNAVPRINHEPPHYLKAVLPDPFLSTGKERQYPSDLAPPRNAKRVYRPRGNRLRGNAKPGLLKLPVELRLVIFRMVLGDRKVHVQYKRGLQSDSNSSQPKVKHPEQPSLILSD